MAETEQSMNPKKVRIGLAIISLIFVISVVMVAVAGDAVSKAIFFAVAAMTLARAALLVRWLRKRAREAA